MGGDVAKQSTQSAGFLSLSLTSFLSLARASNLTRRACALRAIDFASRAG
jgi:hypothetical protein